MSASEAFEFTPAKREEKSRSRHAVVCTQAPNSRYPPPWRPLGVRSDAVLRRSIGTGRWENVQDRAGAAARNLKRSINTRRKSENLKISVRFSPFPRHSSSSAVQTSTGSNAQSSPFPIAFSRSVRFRDVPSPKTYWNSLAQLRGYKMIFSAPEFKSSTLRLLGLTNSVLVKYNKLYVFKVWSIYRKKNYKCIYLFNETTKLYFNWTIRNYRWCNYMLCWYIKVYFVQKYLYFSTFCYRHSQCNL